MRRLLALMLACACLGLGTARATEGGALLTPETLQTLEPAYSAFLNELADTIIARGLLDPAQREEWLLYQLGDFYQNGGYGMIAAMYTPDILALARPEDSLLRLHLTVPAGTLTVETMAAYTPLDSPLPGLMLEASLVDTQGLPIACRFRWRSEQGGFSAWDVLSASVQDVGNEMVNDGRLAYWSDQPVTEAQRALTWRITLDILDPFDDAVTLGKAELTLTPAGTGWVLGSDALR